MLNINQLLLIQEKICWYLMFYHNLILYNIDNCLLLIFLSFIEWKGVLLFVLYSGHTSHYSPFSCSYKYVLLLLYYDERYIRQYNYRQNSHSHPIILYYLSYTYVYTPYQQYAAIEYKYHDTKTSKFLNLSWY